MHQIQIDPRKNFHCGTGRGKGLDRIVNASEALQVLGIEALHTDGKAVDASVPETFKAGQFKGAGVGFQSDLDIVGKRYSGSNTLQDLSDGLCAEQAGLYRHR